MQFITKELKNILRPIFWQKRVIDLDYDGLDPSDYPKFVDAYVCSAYFIWCGFYWELNELELENIEPDYDEVFQCFID